MDVAQPAHALAPPTHVAIIMDGNGRWARARGLPRTAGHRRGADAVRRTVRSAGELGIGYLTLYGFSSENWKRPADEVDDLMKLLRIYNNVRMRVIGNRQRLAPDIIALIDHAEQQTAANTGLTLVIALNYGGRDEITAAVRALADEVAAGRLSSERITETLIAEALTTSGIPDPDLIIRTSGEKRLSNFLLWQSAYSELLFLDVLWPDFSKGDLEQAITEFHRRDRRYGAVAG